MKNISSGNPCGSPDNVFNRLSGPRAHTANRHSQAAEAFSSQDFAILSTHQLTRNAFKTCQGYYLR